MTAAEQSLYQTHGLTYAVGGSENQAILDALVSAVGGRKFEDLTPSMQASLRALLASASTSLGIGPTNTRAANFNALYQGAMSGGIGYSMSSGANMAGLTPAMAATLAASHISSRMRVSDDGISQAVASGLSEDTIDGMLGELMRSGAVNSTMFKQRRVQNIDELLRLVEKGEDGYSLSSEQKTKYKRMKDMRDEMNSIDKMQEQADAMQQQADDSGKQEDMDRAQALRDKVEKSTKDFQSKYSDADIQELKTIESGSLAVTMSADREIDNIKKQIRGSAGVLKKMSGLFGTENFADLQKYAKQLGVNTLATSRGVQEMEGIIKRAKADASLYGMSVQQVLQNQVEARAGLANVWGSERYVPVWAQEQMSRATLSAQANEQFGIDTSEVTAQQASRQADYIAHGRDLNSFRYQISKMDLSDPETAAKAQELLDTIDRFKAAPTNEKDAYRRQAQVLAGELNLSTSESMMREAELNGHSGKDIADSLTRAGVDENIEANIRNDAGGLEAVYNEVEAAGGEIDEEGVIDTAKTMVHIYGGMGSGGTKFVELQEALKKYAGSSGKEAEEQRKQITEMMVAHGVQREAIEEMWENGTLDNMADSESLVKRIDTIMRADKVYDFEGAAVKRAKEVDDMRRLVSESESAENLGLAGKTSGDIVTQFARGMMGRKDLTTAQLVRAAAAGGVVNEAGVGELFDNLEKSGKLEAKTDKKGNFVRDKNGEVVKVFKRADGKEVTREEMINDVKELQSLKPEEREKRVAELREQYGDELTDSMLQQMATAVTMSVDEAGRVIGLGTVDEAGVSSLFDSLAKDGMLVDKVDANGNLVRDKDGNVVQVLKGTGASKEDMIRDAKTLSPDELRAKYGDELAGGLAQYIDNSSVDQFLETHRGQKINDVVITDRESLERALVGSNVNHIAGVNAVADSTENADGSRNVTLTTQADTQIVQDAAQSYITSTYGFSGGEMEKLAKEGLFNMNKDGMVTDKNGNLMFYTKEEQKKLNETLIKGDKEGWDKLRRQYDAKHNEEADAAYDTGGDATLRTIAKLYQNGHYEEAARLQQEAVASGKISEEKAKQMSEQGAKDRATQLMEKTKQRYERFGGGYDDEKWITKEGNKAGEKLKKGERLTAEEASNLLWAATGEDFSDSDHPEQAQTSGILELALGKEGAEAFFEERDAKDGITKERVREVRKAIESIDVNSLDAQQKEEYQYLLDQFRAVEDNMYGVEGVTATSMPQGGPTLNGDTGTEGNSGLINILQEAVKAITSFTQTAERLITDTK